MSNNILRMIRNNANDGENKKKMTAGEVITTGLALGGLAAALVSSSVLRLNTYITRNEFKYNIAENLGKISGPPQVYKADISFVKNGVVQYGFGAVDTDGNLLKNNAYSTEAGKLESSSPVVRVYFSKPVCFYRDTEGTSKPSIKLLKKSPDASISQLAEEAFMDDNVFNSNDKVFNFCGDGDTTVIGLNKFQYVSGYTSANGNFTADGKLETNSVSGVKVYLPLTTVNQRKYKVKFDVDGRTGDIFESKTITLSTSADSSGTGTINITTSGVNDNNSLSVQYDLSKGLTDAAASFVSTHKTIYSGANITLKSSSSSSSSGAVITLTSTNTTSIGDITFKDDKNLITSKVGDPTAVQITSIKAWLGSSKQLADYAADDGVEVNTEGTNNYSNEFTATSAESYLFLEVPGNSSVTIDNLKVLSEEEINLSYNESVMSSEKSLYVGTSNEIAILQDKQGYATLNDNADFLENPDRLIGTDYLIFTGTKINDAFSISPGDKFKIKEGDIETDPNLHIYSLNTDEPPSEIEELNNFRVYHEAITKITPFEGVTGTKFGKTEFDVI